MREFAVVGVLAVATLAVASTDEATYPDYGDYGSYADYDDGDECPEVVSGLYLIEPEGHGNPFPGNVTIVHGTCYPTHGDNCTWTESMGFGNGDDGRPVMLIDNQPFWRRTRSQLGPIAEIPSWCPGYVDEEYVADHEGHVDPCRFDTCAFDGALEVGRVDADGEIFVHSSCIRANSTCEAVNGTIIARVVDHHDKEDTMPDLRCILPSALSEAEVDAWREAMENEEPYHMCGGLNETYRLQTYIPLDPFNTSLGVCRDVADHLSIDCVSADECDERYSWRRPTRNFDTHTDPATCRLLRPEISCKDGRVLSVVEIEEDEEYPGWGGWVEWGGCLAANTCVAPYGIVDTESGVCMANATMPASTFVRRENHHDNETMRETEFNYCDDGEMLAVASPEAGAGMWMGCINKDECAGLELEEYRYCVIFTTSFSIGNGTDENTDFGSGSGTVDVANPSNGTSSSSSSYADPTCSEGVPYIVGTNTTYQPVGCGNSTMCESFGMELEQTASGNLTCAGTVVSCEEQQFDGLLVLGNFTGAPSFVARCFSEQDGGCTNGYEYADSGTAGRCVLVVDAIYEDVDVTIPDFSGFNSSSSLASGSGFDLDFSANSSVTTP